jgi:hypothetical protein
MVTQIVIPDLPQTLPKAMGRPVEVPPETPPEIDFRGLVGEAGWRRLTPDIRRRFAAKAAAHQSKTYAGTMSAVSCSGLGLVFAQFCRLFGTPLAPYRGKDVPVTVHVYPAPTRKGIVWERRYRFPGHREIVVQSTKIWTPATGMTEQLGGGFSMTLRVFERTGRLYFTSKRYYFSLFGWRVPLPLLLTPGRLEVVHAAEGDNRFRFTMTIRHPLLGTTFFQDGLFHDDCNEGEIQ